MTGTTTLPIFVVVDADGDYAIHEDGFDEAVERYEEYYSGSTIVARYQVDLVIPTPDTIKPVRVEVKPRDARRDIPEAFGNAFDVTIDVPD